MVKKAISFLMTLLFLMARCLVYHCGSGFVLNIMFTAASLAARLASL